MNAMEIQNETLLIGEIELLLAEKRTFFSLMRTGAAVFALPLSVFAFLWATLSSTSFVTNPYFIIPVGGLLILVSLIGVHLMKEGATRLKAVNAKIINVKSGNTRLNTLVE